MQIEALHRELLTKTSQVEKFDLLKLQGKAQLQELLIHIDKMQADEKIKNQLNEAILQSMIYQSLHGLSAEALSAKDQWIFPPPKDMLLAFDKMTARLVNNMQEICKTKQISPQEAFGQLMHDNPGWFRQVMNILAKLFTLFLITTQYEVAKEIKRTMPAMARTILSSELKEAERLKKNRIFKHSEEAVQQNSLHEVKKVKKKPAANDAPEAKKFMQNWFEKDATDNQRSDDDAWYETKIKFEFHQSPIKDDNRREVLCAAILEKLLGREKTAKYRLKVDELGNERVISQQVGFDKSTGQYKKAEGLGDFLEKEGYLSQQKMTLQKLMPEEMLREFIKLHAYNIICGNIDLHMNNILVVDKKDLIPIDFGYSLVDVEKYRQTKEPDVPYKSGLLRSASEFREEVKQIVKDVEMRKEELFHHINVVCYCLDIGPAQAKLVVNNVEKNIEYLKHQFHLEASSRCI